MMRHLNRWPALLLAFLLAMAASAVRADTAIAQYKSFRGNVNFVGTEVSMRTSASNPCTVSGSTTSISATLKGIPLGAVVLSAQLYWTGSGNTGDYDIYMDGVAKSASRRFTSSTIGSGFNYFSGAADVTSAVLLKGNGTYTFSGLRIDSGDPWCASSGVVGGFALVVVYSHSSEPTRMLNLYEGFQYIRNSTLTINLSNFLVPNPLDAAMTGRIGHITWEGDSTLSQGGEDLLFNSVALTDTTNPSGNQFNSASNINGDTKSYGIDFDAYVIKAPTIKAGDTTAVTTYRSGSDLVLLSAEVVALPYIVSSDLVLTMTRSGDLSVGTATTYTIKVSNQGLDPEAGPVTVVDTIPAGLRFVSAAGDKWECNSVAQANGSTVVTCKQNGPVNSQTEMTPLVITVNPSAAGTYVNEAVVSGSTADNNTGNNKVTDTSKAVDPGSVPYVYTTRECKAGEAISYAGEAGCPVFTGPVTAAASDVFIFLTAVSGTAQLKATPLSTTASYTQNIQFGATCLPNSSVKAAYAGLNLACDGSLSAAQAVTFAKNVPSATLTNASKFVYNDVGRVKLVSKLAGREISATFVSRPAEVFLVNVLRDVDDYPDANVDSAGVPLTTPTQIAFAKSGELFRIQIGAKMANGLLAPSFGKEKSETVLTNDIPTVATMMPNLQIIAPTLDSTLPNPYVLDNKFAMNALSKDGAGSLMVGSARWFETGAFQIKLGGLPDYLGSGPVLAVTTPNNPNTRWVGRFYPDHFTVGIAPNFDCAAGMACPADNPGAASYEVEGATYSRQSFKVAVDAYSLPAADGKPVLLNRYENIERKATGSTTLLSSKIALAAYRAPAVAGETTQTRAPTDRDTETDFSGFTSVEAVPGPSASFPFLKGDDTPATVSYQLKRGYLVTDARKPSPVPWTKPTPIYLRATAADTRMVWLNKAAGTSKQEFVSISSVSDKSGERYEDGIMILAGRTFVGNVFGSQAQRVPVQLQAQYWNGTAWVANASNLSTSTVGAAIALDSCSRDFGKPPTDCKANGVAPVSASGVAFSAVAAQLGTATMMLVAPARNVNGAIDFHLTGGNAENWLPSTKARASFGLANSPLIYIREVY